MNKTFNCYLCRWFDNKGRVCDMCDYGYPYTTDNHGKFPQEVEDCNAFRIIDSLVPLLPKKGDLCWFWCKGDSYPTIGKFIKYGETYENRFKADVFYETHNLFDGTEFRDDWEHCEPFKGTLPTLLKNPYTKM